jgi:exopolysaccharide biosynthesis polyprenyl glycosylphosphotransferase
LVVGAGWAGQTMVQTINKFGVNKPNLHAIKSYQVLGFIDDDSSKQSKSVLGLSVLGSCENLVQLTKELQPDDLILAITDRGNITPKMFDGILACRELGVSIVSMQSLYEQLTNQVPLEHSGRNLEVIIPLELSVGQRIYPIFREMADILCAIAGFLLLCLAIPVVWTVNRLTSPGPLMYKQERVGKAGKTFNMIKFRSMVVAAEESTGAVWARTNDDRITPFGKFMRKSRIDELPQFLNILRGEMSLVGPRPERPRFVSVLEKEIPFYRLRHAVKPGITGWAQVQYGYGASVEDAFVKLGYDFYYIKNQSLFLDVTIILKSLAVVFGLKGR